MKEETDKYVLDGYEMVEVQRERKIAERTCEVLFEQDFGGKCAGGVWLKRPPSLETILKLIRPKGSPGHQFSEKVIIPISSIHTRTVQITRQTL